MYPYPYLRRPHPTAVAVGDRPHACLIEKEAFVLLECQGKSQSFGSSPDGGWIETCLVFKDRI